MWVETLVLVGCSFTQAAYVSTELNSILQSWRLYKDGTYHPAEDLGGDPYD